MIPHHSDPTPDLAPAAAGVRRPLVAPAVALLLLLGLLAAAPPARAEHRLGGGIRYFRAIDDVDDVDGIEDDGSSLVASYQYKPRGLFTFEIDLEYFEDGFAGSTEEAFSPQAMVLIGGFVYGGVGVGVTISDGLEDNTSDPFFMARIGLDFSLLGALHLDIGATYRFDDWEGVENIDLDSDTFTLGAIARISF